MLPAPPLSHTAAPAPTWPVHTCRRPAAGTGAGTAFNAQAMSFALCSVVAASKLRSRQARGNRGTQHPQAPGASSSNTHFVPFSTGQPACRDLGSSCPSGVRLCHSSAATQAEGRTQARKATKHTTDQPGRGSGTTRRHGQDLPVCSSRLFFVTSTLPSTDRGCCCSQLSSNTHTHIALACRDTLHRTAHPSHLCPSWA